MLKSKNLPPVFLLYKEVYSEVTFRRKQRWRMQEEVKSSGYILSDPIRLSDAVLFMKK